MTIAKLCDPHSWRYTIWDFVNPFQKSELFFFVLFSMVQFKKLVKAIFDFRGVMAAGPGILFTAFSGVLCLERQKKMFPSKENI